MATVSYAHAIVKPENIISFGVTGTDQFDPDVIAHPDGGFIVAYTNTEAATGSDFATSNVSGNVAPLGNSGYAPAGEQTALRGTMLSNGGTLFAGVHATAAGAAGGTSIDTMPFPSSVHKLVGDQADNQTQPDVAGLTGDRAVIVYTDQFNGSATDTDVRMTVMNNDGTVIVKNNVFVAGTNGAERAPKVAALPNGGFVVAWTDATVIAQPKLFAQRYDSDGNLLGAKITIDDVGGNDKIDIVGLAGGGFAAVYEDTQYTGGKDISLRVFDKNGAALAGPARIHGDNALDDLDPSIAQLSSGHLAVSWTRAVTAGNNDLYLRYFAADGAAVTGEIRYQGTDVDAFNQRQSSLAATGDGRLFAAWTDGQVLDAAGTHVGASIFALQRTTTGDGTSEYLAGDTLHDIINGLGGGDSLVGGRGDDQLFGGDGADYLHANFYGVDGLMQAKAGNDMFDGGGADGLFGGDGQDTMNGGAGDDAMVGGGGHDVMNGGDDADFLFGGAFGAGGERLAGSGQDTLSGGAGRDALYGFDGNDIINGDAGDDYVEGGAGQDTINGGSGNDYLLGEDNTDTINGGTGFDYLYGGAGADEFIFKKSDSADWILDFSAAQGDKLKLEGFGFANFAAIPLVDLSTPGNPAVQMTFVDGANVDQLTIFGVTLAQLNASNVLVG